MKGFRELSSEVEVWGKRHLIPSSALQLVRSLPAPFGLDPNLKEFYIQNDGVFGRKHYVPSGKEAKLIEWLKLTHELFFPHLG